MTIKSFLLTGLLVAVALPCCAATPEDSSGQICLDVAQSLVRSHKDVVITRTDSSSLRGRLLAVDVGASTLALATSDKFGIHELTIPKSEIATLGYSARGKFRPIYTILGAGLGLLLGHVAETQVFDRGGNAKIFKDADQSGWSWGTLGGAVAGTVVSLLVPYTKQVVCGER